MNRTTASPDLIALLRARGRLRLNAQVREDVDTHDVLVHDLGALGLGQEEVDERGQLHEEVEGNGADQRVREALYHLHYT